MLTSFSSVNSYLNHVCASASLLSPCHMVAVFKYFSVSLHIPVDQLHSYSTYMGQCSVLNSTDLVWEGCLLHFWILLQIYQDTKGRKVHKPFLSTLPTPLRNICGPRKSTVLWGSSQVSWSSAPMPLKPVVISSQNCIHLSLPCSEWLRRWHMTSPAPGTFA